jgi:hypothetical protein
MFSFQLSLGVTSKMTSAIDSNAELRKCMTSLGFSFSDDTSKKIKAFLMCNKPKGKGKIEVNFIGKGPYIDLGEPARGFRIGGSVFKPSKYITFEFIANEKKLKVTSSDCQFTLSF